MSELENFLKKGKKLIEAEKEFSKITDQYHTHPNESLKKEFLKKRSTFFVLQERLGLKMEVVKALIEMNDLINNLRDNVENVE